MSACVSLYVLCIDDVEHPMYDFGIRKLSWLMEVEFLFRLLPSSLWLSFLVSVDGFLVGINLHGAWG